MKRTAALLLLAGVIGSAVSAFGGDAGPQQTVSTQLPVRCWADEIQIPRKRLIPRQNAKPSLEQTLVLDQAIPKDMTSTMQEDVADKIAGRDGQVVRDAVRQAGQPALPEGATIWNDDGKYKHSARLAGENFKPVGEPYTITVRGKHPTKPRAPESEDAFDARARAPGYRKVWLRHVSLSGSRVGSTAEKRSRENRCARRGFPEQFITSAIAAN